VSNTLLFDPPLVRGLANELRQRLAGRACGAAPSFAADLSVTLPLDRDEQLRVDLHPTRGWIRILSSPGIERDELDATCLEVTAPPDERILRIRLLEEGRFRSAVRTLVLELHTNQWNALVLDDEERILAVLRSRRAGARSLVAGERYLPPTGSARFDCLAPSETDAWARWRRDLEGGTDSERRGALIAGFAETGALNADWVLAPAVERNDLKGAFRRWWWLCRGPEGQPHLLRIGNRVLPYPFPLEGVPGEPCPSLLAGMADLAESEVIRPAEAPEQDADREAALALARDRLAASRRKVERLRRELASAAEAPRIRGMGDLLLARLHEVPRGTDRVRLEGWDGDEVEIGLDPQLAPAENAARFYEQARRMTRAEAQIPRLIDAAGEESQRWRDAEAEVERGRVPEWVSEQLKGRERSPARGQGATASVPYRRFRTSGGLEVRVGRTSRDNDRLTFHASSPNDVWLHARSVPGSHVILRWPQVDAAPPARDLHEAAQLAAVFSKARSSGTVAVDWTRRKHVRKPRGAAPGLVIPQHSRTVFVEPDEEVVERLAVEG
jgi:predicted ribosome quality control (RQC) complex YloA/Tae2 family protein